MLAGSQGRARFLQLLTVAVLSAIMLYLWCRYAAWLSMNVAVYPLNLAELEARTLDADVVLLAGAKFGVQYSSPIAGILEMKNSSISALGYGRDGGRWATGVGFVDWKVLIVESSALAPLRFLGMIGSSADKGKQALVGVSPKGPAELKAPMLQPSAQYKEAGSKTGADLSLPSIYLELVPSHRT